MKFVIWYDASDKRETLNLISRLQQVFNGVPSENLYGSDLRPDFMELGYKLFKDRDSLKSKFIAADVFDPSSELLQLKGQINIIYVGAFFHLFDYDEQVNVAKRILELLEDKPNTLVLGRQVGNDNAGPQLQSGYKDEKPRYRHNAASWEKFWDDIGEQTQTKWKTEVILDAPWEGLSTKEIKLMGLRGEKGSRRLRYVVRRIE